MLSNLVFGPQNVFTDFIWVSRFSNYFLKYFIKHTFLRSMLFKWLVSAQISFLVRKHLLRSEIHSCGCEIKWWPRCVTSWLVGGLGWRPTGGAGGASGQASPRYMLMVTNGRWRKSVFLFNDALRETRIVSCLWTASTFKMVINSRKFLNVLCWYEVFNWMECSTNIRSSLNSEIQSKLLLRQRIKSWVVLLYTFKYKTVK